MIKEFFDLKKKLCVRGLGRSGGMVDAVDSKSTALFRRSGMRLIDIS
jgi:hypothetical protein